MKPICPRRNRLMLQVRRKPGNRGSGAALAGDAPARRGELEHVERELAVELTCKN